MNGSKNLTKDRCANQNFGQNLEAFFVLHETLILIVFFGKMALTVLIVMTFFGKIKKLNIIL